MSSKELSPQTEPKSIDPTEQIRRQVILLMEENKARASEKRLLQSRIENIEFYLSHEHGDLTPMEETVLPLSPISRARIKRHNERVAEHQQITQEYEAKKARIAEINVQTREAEVQIEQLRARLLRLTK